MIDVLNSKTNLFDISTNIFFKKKKKQDIYYAVFAQKKITVGNLNKTPKREIFKI